MKFRTCISLLLASVVFAPLVLGQEPKKADEKDKRDPSIFMKKKLEYSEKILAGLTSGDFDQVKENAKEMHALGNIEAFFRIRSPGYRTQFLIFENANDELIAQADKKNYEGVALAFNQLTNSCVNCHKQLREMKPGKERSK
jgi:hypothetical protein